MIKRNAWLATAALSLLLLVGCSNTAVLDPQEEMEALVDRITEASSSVDSYSSRNTAEQEFTMYKDGEVLSTEKNFISSQAEFTREPAAFYEARDTNHHTTGETSNTLSYVTEEGYFMNISGDWIKLPDDRQKHALMSSEANHGPLVQFHRFRDYAENVQLTEEDDHYILRLELTGEQVQGGKTNLDESALNHLGMTDTMTISYVVNKADDLPSRIELESEYTVKLDDIVHLRKVSESFDITYNQAPPIHLPPEAIENAVPVNSVGKEVTPEVTD
ncbi:DUF6612 family protein [Paenibacillus daejeonensis]|uniref:DUF6612 family protein n=1 Tax=Paenibacillus daejeonensis TaxID=135193 RepID=UPI000365058A|nr:DUF6612 family protein [Paenibacillus daejeonensis]